MTDPTDLGPGELYPFCTIPAVGKRLKLHDTWYARNGDPAEIVRLVDQSMQTGHAVRARRVSPIEHYRSHCGGQFEAYHFDAAADLAKDYEQMLRGIEPGATDWGRPIVDGMTSPGISDKTLIAIRRVNQAFQALPEPRYVAQVTHGIVCGSLPMAEIEDRLGLTKRTGRVYLLVGLHNLAIHYNRIARDGRAV